MSYYDIILLAYALSIDVCIVSFSYGLCLEAKHKRSAFILALTTACFHIFMPLLGHFFTDLVRIWLQPYANFIAFAIFMYLGVNFILESLKKEKPQKLCLTFKSMLLISVATSIDVFSAGISLSLISSPMKFAVIVFGIITFLNSLFGYSIGYKLRTLQSKWLEITGGVILVVLAIKSLF